MTDESIALQLEDNAIEGKFSSFAKFNLRLSKQLILPITPSRTASAIQSSHYTLKVHYKHRTIQDHILTSIPMVILLDVNFLHL